MDITPFFGTAWALFPPIVAIILALLTKEVYSSLFIKLRIELFPTVYAIIIIVILISIEYMYSAFPCPKLWSSSAFLDATLLPINVISDAIISPAELNASITTLFLIQQTFVSELD